MKDAFGGGKAIWQGKKLALYKVGLKLFVAR
jgi:hypothetical protein